MVKNRLKKLSDDQFEKIAKRFKALGEESRLKIIACLQSGELSVTDIVEMTGLAQPNVSRHLDTLVNCGFVSRRKSGNCVIYKISDQTLSELCGIVCKSICD